MQLSGPKCAVSLCVCFHAFGYIVCMCWVHTKHVRTDCTCLWKQEDRKRVGLTRDVSHNGPKPGISSRNQRHLVDTDRDCSGGGGAALKGCLVEAPDLHPHLCRDTAGQERFRTITTAYYRGAMVSEAVAKALTIRPLSDVPALES